MVRKILTTAKSCDRKKEKQLSYKVFNLLALLINHVNTFCNFAQWLFKRRKPWPYMYIIVIIHLQKAFNKSWIFWLSLQLAFYELNKTQFSLWRLWMFVENLPDDMTQGCQKWQNSSPFHTDGLVAQWTSFTTQLHVFYSLCFSFML